MSRLGLPGFAIIRRMSSVQASCRTPFCGWPGAAQWWISRSYSEDGPLIEAATLHSLKWHTDDAPGGFRVWPDFERRRELHVECRLRGCTWNGQTPHWVSPGRRQPWQLLRFAQAHANGWHPGAIDEPLISISDLGMSLEMTA